MRREAVSANVGVEYVFEELHDNDPALSST
jgi:hypothetical protein